MTNMLEKVEELISIAAKKGAQSADAIGFESSDATATVRNGNTEGIERSDSKAIGLRVFIGKRKAIVSTTDLSTKILNDLAEQAVSMAKLAPEDPFTDLASSEQLAKSFDDLDLYDETEPSPNSLLERAKETEAAALSVDGITNSEGSDCSFGKYSTALATSNGFAKQYKTSSHSLSVSVIAKGDEGMERDYDYSLARHLSDIRSPQSIGNKAAELTIKRRNPGKAKTGTCPVIFDKRVAKSLIGSFLSAINGSSVARNTSFLKDSMGKLVFADNINIVNDPFRKRGMASKLFDAEGVAPQKLDLIKNGVLQNWLLDIRSANQLGLKSNGCASRQLNSNPFPSSTNVYMENGEKSVNELISNISYGILVTETFGMGVNTVTGDYSQGAGGFLIENGLITTPVSEFTIASNLNHMLANAIPANDLEFIYGTNSPSLLIDGIMVAGQDN